MLQASPRAIEQRTNELPLSKGLALWHGRQTTHPGATFERQQQSLELIILMVGRQQVSPSRQMLGQSPIASLASPGLQTLASGRRHGHPLDDERNPQFITHPLAVSRPPIG